MKALRRNIKSFICSRSSGPRIFWCAAFLLWGSVNACDMTYSVPSPEEVVREQLEIKQRQLETRREVSQSSVLVLGRVERVTEVPGVFEQGMSIFLVHLRVRRSWKGAVQPGTQFTLKLLSNGSTCGPLLPEIDDSFVVWVKRGMLDPKYVNVDGQSYHPDAERWASATLAAVIEALSTESKP